MSATPAISMNNITFSYGKKNILQNFNLNITSGQTHCLVGSSGSGKTTILGLMNGLLQPDKGKIYIGDELFDFSKGEQWRRSMGYSMQGSGLFPHLTLSENLSLIARKEGWSTEKVHKRIKELCELMTLPYTDSFLQKKPRQISGGQQQRIGIARALFMKPKVMLMDEPFSALDPITRSELQKEFIKLQKQLKLTIVLVTHDLPEAFSMADTMILLNEGRIEQADKPSRFLLNPKSDYVKDFIQSHSPGNLLKEIYLYSVVNSNVYTVKNIANQIEVENIETKEKSSFDSIVRTQDFLSNEQQSCLYWINEKGVFTESQTFDSNGLNEKKTHSIESTRHILDGMKSILKLKQSTLPVTNAEGKLIGVFSEEALSAL